MYYKVISERYIFQYRWPVLKTLYRKYDIFSKEKLTSTLKTFFCKRRSKFVELQAVMFLVYLKYISRQKGNLKDLLLSTT